MASWHQFPCDCIDMLVMSIQQTILYHLYFGGSLPGEPIRPELHLLLRMPPYPRDCVRNCSLVKCTSDLTSYWLNRQPLRHAKTADSLLLSHRHVSVMLTMHGCHSVHALNLIWMIDWLSRVWRPTKHIIAPKASTPWIDTWKGKWKINWRWVFGFVAVDLCRSTKLPCVQPY